MREYEIGVTWRAFKSTWDEQAVERYRVMAEDTGDARRTLEKIMSPTQTPVRALMFQEATVVGAGDILLDENEGDRHRLVYFNLDKVGN